MQRFGQFLKDYKWLLIVLSLAFFLRVVDIDNNPKSLYGDELTLVYDSYSILKTGSDSTGAFLPITFRMGEGRPGGYVYGSIPFVAIFGPTPLGVRSLSIISGLGIIILMYMLGKALFNRQVGLFASVITTILPWDISLSRAGFEAHLALFLALLGVTALIYGKNRKNWLIAAISFGLTIHTYPTYKVVLPIFILLFLWFIKIKFRDLFTKKVVVATIVLGVFALIAITQIFIGGSENRFANLNIFSKSDVNEQIIQKLNIERNNDSLPNVINQFFHNRPVAYGQVFLDSYLENFSPDFLFNYGDGIPTHNPATTGELFFVQIILVGIGIGFLFWEKRKHELLFLLGWLLIAPISTAILGQTHALRDAFMIPPLVLFSSLGTYSIWQKRKFLTVKVLMAVLLVALIGQFVFFVDELYFVSPNRLSDFWSYPARKASLIAIQSSPNFNYVIMSNSIENIQYAYLVYAKIDPKQVQPAGQQFQIFAGIKFKKYGNILIGDVTKSNAKMVLSSIPGSVLFIARPDWRQTFQNTTAIQVDQDLLWMSR